MSTTPLINRRQVRDLALTVARQTRAKSFSRVSGRFLEDINAQVRVYVSARVRTMPSRGVTL